MAGNGYGEQSTKVVGGNLQIAQALKVQPGQGTIDQLCEQHLGGYRLIKKLGQGGMGSVYKAEQMSLRRDVAIKMLDPRLAQNKAYLERFTSEAKAAAQLNHRNLVQIFDVGESHGVFYFSMEYIDGQDVGQILDRMHDEDPSTIPPKVAIDVMIPIVSALSAAHAIGIVHRDVKPDNIMISVDGTPKLADLGIAKVLSGGQDHRRTEVGAQLGTPHYVSPEQARDPGSVDPRADIYSLGATLFHMVTGRPPYEGNNPATILRKLQTEPVPSAHDLNPSVPFALSNAISRMMAKIPHERYANTEELYAVLIDLRLQLSNKGGTQKVGLGQGSTVRIEASDTDAEIELHLAGDEPAKEEDLYTYVPRVARPGRPAGGVAPVEAIDDPDQYVPSVMRPEGPRPANLGEEAPPRPPMSRPARPGASARPGGSPSPRPGGAAAASGGGPPRAAIFAGIGGGVVVLALVGMFVFGGKTKRPTLDPVVVPLDPIGKVRPPDVPIRVRTQEEIDEERAKDVWVPLAEQRVAGLADEALDKLEAEIAQLCERFPKTAAAGEAGFRLDTVRREQQERQYRALKSSIDAKVAAGKFHSANAEVEAFLAQYKDGHIRSTAVRRDLETVLHKAGEALADVLSRASSSIAASRFDEAKAMLEAAASDQIAEGQAKIATQLREVESERDIHQRLIELDRYPGYFVKLAAEKGSVDKWFTYAEQEFSGTMVGVHPRELELADLSEVKGAREAVVAALRARINKEVVLSFVGDARPKSDVIKACDGEKISMSSRLKYVNQLKAESLVELAGPTLEGPDGQLRLALLLLSMGRDDEAKAALEKGRAAASFRRYQLRFLSPDVIAARNLSGGTGVRKDEDWARSLVAAQRLVQLDPHSPYRLALERLARTLIEPATKVLRPSQVFRQATLAANAGNVEVARLLCQVVLAHFNMRDEPQTALDAQRLLDSLAGR